MPGQKYFYLFLMILALNFISCEKDSKESYVTKNVIIIIIDGARYSETWGDTGFVNIPRMKELSETGVLFTEFYNEGTTHTTSATASITTGNYQEIDNLGDETPWFPSMFQYWNQQKADSLPLSRIFASKDKLSVLSDCLDPAFAGIFRPISDCGVDERAAANSPRHDSITLRLTLNSLTEDHPSLVFLGFREPDFSAHQNDWQGYIEGIRNTDKYVSRIWDFIESDPFYKGRTSIFVTNDHGRHLDNIEGGFVLHGDTCMGCRHVSLLAIGPDFRKGEVIKVRRELVDISPTIAEILNFRMPTASGHIMNELFK
jgi:hypothetical protein